MGGAPPQQMAHANPADLVNNYQALFAQFIKYETQKKVQADTENKLAIMVEKVNGNQLKDLTIQKLYHISSLV